jgi:hypothetical protein
LLSTGLLCPRTMQIGHVRLRRGHSPMQRKESDAFLLCASRSTVSPQLHQAARTFLTNKPPRSCSTGFPALVPYPASAPAPAPLPTTTRTAGAGTVASVRIGCVCVCVCARASGLFSRVSVHGHGQALLQEDCMRRWSRRGHGRDGPDSGRRTTARNMCRMT